ncbi:MAG: hypothetical protein MJ132_07925, partial [Clostridia bacterium]|nr:hypothetical protein [Clostridia bacterium]
RDSTDNQLGFYLMTTQAGTIFMDFQYDISLKKIMISADYFIDDEYAFAMAEMLVTEVGFEKNAIYNFTYNTTPRDDQYLSELYNQLFEISLIVWDDILYDNCGLHMKDIGFTSFQP